MTSFKKQIDMDTILEQAHEAGVSADRYQKQLSDLRRDFEARPDVADLLNKIQKCEDHRKYLIQTAHTLGIKFQKSEQLEGVFRLREKTRISRTVVPRKFAEKFGEEAFWGLATVPVGRAERLVGKVELEEVVERETHSGPVVLEYSRE